MLRPTTDHIIFLHVLRYKTLEFNFNLLTITLRIWSYIHRNKQLFYDKKNCVVRLIQEK